MNEDLKNSISENPEQKMPENEAESQVKSEEKEQQEAPNPESILKEKIAKLEKVVIDQNDKMLRSLAEIENLRKRSIEDLEKANKYAISKFASDLVLVVENFYLAVDNMPVEEIEKNEKIKNFATGVIMTQKELVKIFEKNGIKRINPVNEKFDHNYHQAIAEADGEGESGFVKKVIQAGYLIEDRLIRPALVEIYK